MKKVISFLVMSVVVIFSFASCNKPGGNDIINSSNDSETVTVNTSETGNPVMTESDTQTSEETGPVPFIAEIMYTGTADGVALKIDEMLHNELVYNTVYKYPCAFAVNSAEGLEALARLKWTHGVPEFEPLLYDEEFFKSGFILITLFWTGSSGFKFDISVNSCDSEMIIINKIWKLPFSQDGIYGSDCLMERHIAYNVIHIPYNNQSLRYIETQAP